MLDDLECLTRATTAAYSYCIGEVFTENSTSLVHLNDANEIDAIDVNL